LFALRVTLSFVSDVSPDIGASRGRALASIALVAPRRTYCRSRKFRDDARFRRVAAGRTTLLGGFAATEYPNRPSKPFSEQALEAKIF
jgi:hypothetical protein